MRYVTLVVAAVLTIIGVEVKGQTASLELVERFHHMMDQKTMHEYCLHAGSYVVAAKPEFERYGGGSVHIDLPPIGTGPGDSERRLWLHVSPESHWDYAYVTFVLASYGCITVESIFAFGRIYRLSMETAPWPERVGNTAPFPPPIPPCVGCDAQPGRVR